MGAWCAGVGPEYGSEAGPGLPEEGNIAASLDVVVLNHGDASSDVMDSQDASMSAARHCALQEIQMHGGP